MQSTVVLRVFKVFDLILEKSGGVLHMYLTSDVRLGPSFIGSVGGTAQLRSRLWFAEKGDDVEYNLIIQVAVRRDINAQLFD